MSKEYLEAAWRESRSWDSDLHETKCFQEAIERLEKAEAKLEKVAGLPDKWRDISEKQTQEYTDMDGCADELQSILNREKRDEYLSASFLI